MHELYTISTTITTTRVLYISGGGFDKFRLNARQHLPSILFFSLVFLIKHCIVVVECTFVSPPPTLFFFGCCLFYPSPSVVVGCRARAVYIHYMYIHGRRVRSASGRRLYTWPPPSVSYSLSSTAEEETAVRQIANKKRQTRASCALKTFLKKLHFKFISNGEGDEHN